MEMEFEWNPGKDRLNLLKHRVAFKEAALVFLDPYRIEAFDGREAYGEDRWRRVGCVAPSLLTGVYTIRDRENETIRLISARKADSYEQAQYREI